MISSYRILSCREMDGVALLKAVKKIRPNIFFIMLTAYGTIQNAVEAMKLGAFTYVIKGSDPEELLKEIRNIKKLKQAQSQGSIQSGRQGRGLYAAGRRTACSAKY